MSAKAFEDEFSPFLIGSLTSYFAGLLDYLAQYPEWQRFLENSISTRIIDEQLLDDLRHILGKLQPELGNPEIVNPEVGQKLKWLTTLIDGDRPLTQKVLMAVALSVHNLASVVVKWGLDFAKDTLQDTRKMAVKGMAVAFLGTIALALWPFIPIATLITRYPWLEQALTVLKDIGTLAR